MYYCIILHSTILHEIIEVKVIIEVEIQTRIIIKMAIIINVYLQKSHQI